MIIVLGEALEHWEVSLGNACTCFNIDGLLSQDALNLLDGGNLDCFSGAPLDSLVGNGVYVKDVVRNVLMGSFTKLLPNLGFVLSSSADNRAPDGLLDVESVLQLMGFGKADKVRGVRMLGPSGLLSPLHGYEVLQFSYYRFSCYFGLGLRSSFKVVCNATSFVSRLFF
ncbi:hypothetical protein ACET3Z_021645 [Daucus carota]